VQNTTQRRARPKEPSWVIEAQVRPPAKAEDVQPFGPSACEKGQFIEARITGIGGEVKMKSPATWD